MATSYYVHLGFDWYSYKIGSVWGSNLKIPQSDDYFLQFALTTNQDGSSTVPWNATLFQFDTGDSLYFKIWDLTSWQQPYPTVSVQGYLGLNSLDGYTSYGENTVFDTSNASAVFWLTGENYLQFVTSMSASPAPYSPWGACAAASNCQIGPLTVNAPSSSPWPFKMNFCLKVGYSITTPPDFAYNIFLSDPEVIISSTG